VGNLTTPVSKVPELIAMNLDVSSYVGNPPLPSKYGSDMSAWVVLVHA